MFTKNQKSKIRNYLFYVIVFNSLFHTVFGNTPDSLENVLKRTTSDTEKVSVYNIFARDLIKGSKQSRAFQQGLQWAQQGLALAEQMQYENGRAESHLNIGEAYYSLNDFVSAIYHYEKALSLYEKLKDIKGIAQCYYSISVVYRNQSKSYYALELLQKSLSLWKQLNNTNEMIRVYRDIVRLYRDVGEMQLAEDFADEAIQLAKETGNQSKLASLYDILARIYVTEGNEQVAEEYYQKSLEIYEELNDQLQIANVTYSMARWLPSNTPEMVIDLLRKSVVLFEKASPDNNLLYDVYNALANGFQAANDIDSAKYYKEIALNKAILSRNKRTIANAHYTLGMFYVKIGNASRAEKDFRESHDIAIKNELYDVLSKALLELSLLNNRKGNYKTSFEYLQKYHVINDSLNREENKRNVQQLTQQYEFEKEMTEKNETIKIQLERQEQAMKYQKTIVSIISVALAFSAILLGFIFRSNKRNRQANIKLEHQHREILRINDELNESHQELSRYKDNLEEMVIEQTAKLQQSELQLRTLSDNLPGGCIYQKCVYEDGKETISYISNTAEEWLGLSAEIIMEDILRFYRQMAPEDLEKKRKLEQESISSMSSYSCEYRFIKGNQEVWLLENAMPRSYTDQNIVWDGIVVDITDRKKFEKDLIEAKEHAEESDRLKSAFLANMSHEIRTPMNGIVGFLGFIERESLPIEKRQAYTGIIRNNVQQLLQLIGDIIDISKIDSNSLALNKISFDVNKLLNELEIFYREFILKQDKRMELILDRGQFISPSIIKSDPFRLRQVLSNFIGNAIKFTEIGYIRFGYSLTEHGDNLYFFVEDTGIGIPKSKQDFIFERFRQAHDEKTQTLYGGTGLGLAISKSLVEMMNGQIGVESKEDVGSTFYITLPYCPDNFSE